MSRINEVRPMGLPTEHEIHVPKRDTRLDGEITLHERYHAIRFSWVINNGLAGQDVTFQRYQTPGDTLTVVQCDGPAPYYIRVGSTQNPFLYVREGTVITHPFREFTIAAGTTTGLSITGGRRGGSLLCYASFGPLIEYPPKEYGLRRGFYAKHSMQVNTTMQTISNLLTGNPAALAFNTFGRYGGSIMIKNEDFANPIYIGWVGTTGAVNGNGYTINPGESVTLRIETCMGQLTVPDPPFNLLYVDNLAVFTSAGTANCSILITDDQGDAGFPGLAPTLSPSLP